MHTPTRLTLAASGLLTLALAAPAAAQSAAAGPVGPAVQPDRNNQAIERIRVEDKGSRTRGAAGACAQAAPAASRAETRRAVERMPGL